MIHESEVMTGALVYDLAREGLVQYTKVIAPSNAVQARVMINALAPLSQLTILQETKLKLLESIRTLTVGTSFADLQKFWEILVPKTEALKACLLYDGQNPVPLFASNDDTYDTYDARRYWIYDEADVTAKDWLVTAPKARELVVDTGALLRGYTDVCFDSKSMKSDAHISIKDQRQTLMELKTRGAQGSGKEVKFAFPTAQAYPGIEGGSNAFMHKATTNPVVILTQSKWYANVTPAQVNTFLAKAHEGRTT